VRAHRGAVAVVAAFGLVAGGCESRTPPQAVGVADTTSPEGHFAAVSNTPNAPGCVLGALWQQCGVRERLDRAGLAPVVGDSVRQPFLHVPGRRYRVGDAELQVFVYETVEMRRRDTAPLDSVRVAPPGTQPAWERTPTLITSGNLAAILVGGNERQVERVTLALTAGAGTTEFQSPTSK
jgi:hypothetical protein